MKLYISILALAVVILGGVTLSHAGGELDVSQYGYTNDGTGLMDGQGGATGTSATTEDDNLAAAVGTTSGRAFQLFMIFAAVIIVISLLVWVMRKNSAPVS